MDALDRIKQEVGGERVSLGGNIEGIRLPVNRVGGFLLFTSGDAGDGYTVGRYSSDEDEGDILLDDARMDEVLTLVDGANY